VTSSQITTAIGGAVAFIGGLTTAVTPFLPFVPARYKDNVQLGFGLLGAVGVALASFNQSLSGNHVSLPKDEALALAEGDPLGRKALERIREVAGKTETG
jgi:hypothetical protein